MGDRSRAPSSGSARIRLVTRGDDAGATRSANRAIRDAFETGILRNASVMACGPAIEHAGELLGGLTGLCLGLHLTLTSEWDGLRWGPVSPTQSVATLVDGDGTFARTTQALIDRSPAAEDVLLEACAQLARMREVGLDPVYVDEHMGVGRAPTVRAAIADFARREGLLTIPVELQRQRLPTASGRSPIERFVAAIAAAEPGDYLMVTHPAFDDAETRALTQGASAPAGHVAAERNGERLTLSAPAVLKACEAAGVRPTRVDEWLAPTAGA